MKTRDPVDALSEDLNISAFSFLKYSTMHAIKPVSKGFNTLATKTIEVYNNEFVVHLEELGQLLQDDKTCPPVLPLPPRIDAISYYKSWMTVNANYFYRKFEIALADFFDQIHIVKKDSELAEHPFLKYLNFALDYLDSALFVNKQHMHPFIFSDPELINRLCILAQSPRLEQRVKMQLCRLALRQATHRNIELFTHVVNLGDGLKALTVKDYTDAVINLVGTSGLNEKLPLLLNKGADPNVVLPPESKEHLPEPLLAKAARLGDFKIVLKLLEAKADPKVLDREGYPVMHRIIDSSLYSYDEKTRLVNELLKNRVDPNAVGTRGCPALVRAAIGGFCFLDPVKTYYPTIILALLEAGANVFAQDEHGYDALYYARLFKVVEIERILDEHIVQQTKTRSFGR